MLDFMQSKYTTDRLKKELSGRINIDRLLKEIDARPGITGAGVIYFDGLNVATIREFQPICQIKPVHIVIRSVSSGLVSSTQPMTQHLNQQNKPMYSALREAGSMGLACGAAVLGWVVVLGSGAAAIPTGGVSTAVTVLAFSAAAASTTQCVAGIARTAIVLADKDEWLYWLDSEAWYQKTMIALDVVSLAGATAAVAASIKTLQLLKATGTSSVIRALKQMPRHERKRLTESLIRQMHPGISNGAIKSFMRAGVYPARYTSTQVSHTLKIQLTDAVGAALSFGGSFSGGLLRNTSRMKDLVFGISYPVETL